MAYSLTGMIIGLIKLVNLFAPADNVSVNAPVLIGWTYAIPFVTSTSDARVVYPFEIKHSTLPPAGSFIELLPSRIRSMFASVNVPAEASRVVQLTFANAPELVSIPLVPTVMVVAVRE